MVRKNIITSQNLERVKYDGGYSIHVTEDADLLNLPISVKVNGRILYVSCGKVRQVMGAISFCTDGQKFKLPYNHLRCVCDSYEKPIWINYKLLQNR